MNKEKSEDGSLSYDTYLKERESLVDSEREGAKSFDKFVLTLSAGAIALSLTFINQIASEIFPWTIWFLVTAWGSLVLSMLSTMLSLLTSQASCRKQRDILDDLYKNKHNNVEQGNILSIWTNRLNITSMIFFILGVIFLLTFSIINISKGGCKMGENKKDKIEKGGFSAQKAPKTEELKEGIVAQKPPVEQKTPKENTIDNTEKGFVPQKPPQLPKEKNKE